MNVRFRKIYIDTDISIPMEKIPRGILKYLILKLLDEKPDTGYGIISRIEEKTGFWKPSTGSIYPLLENLTDKGLIKKSEIGGRAVYKLTEKGKRALKEIYKVKVETLEKIRNAHIVLAKIFDDPDLFMVAKRVDEKIKRSSIPIFALIPRDLIEILEKLHKSNVDKSKVLAILEDAKSRLEALLKEETKHD